MANDRSPRGMRFDEAKQLARDTVGVCPALILEDERRADGFLGYHVCMNRSHPELKPYCGVHRGIIWWREELNLRGPKGEG